MVGLQIHIPRSRHLELFEELLHRSFSNGAEGNDEAVVVLPRGDAGSCPPPAGFSLQHLARLITTP